MIQRITMIVFILIIVLGGGLYAYKQLVPPEVQETQGPVYATKEVVRGDISVGVETKGMLNPTRGGAIRIPGERRFDGTPISYIIDEILLEEGDEVKKGQVIAILSSADLEMKIEEKEETLEARRKELAEMTGVSVDEVDDINPAEGITIKAPIGGRVTNLDVEEGDELKSGHAVCRIVDDSKFRVRAKLTPSEIKMVSKGQKVVLNFPYFDGLVDAVVTEISGNPAPEDKEEGFGTGFIYGVIIEGKNPGLVQTDMEVRVGIPQKDNNQAVYFCSKTAKVEGFIKEKKVINRTEAIVTEVYVHDMEIVEEGDLLVSMAGTDIQESIQEKVDDIRELKVELMQLRAKMDQLEIKASMDGVIASIHRQEGETVNPGEWMGDIFNTSQMVLWAQVDDIDIVNVKQDAPVEVKVDAVPDQTFKGKVTHISTRGEDMNGITRFSVGIEVEGGPMLRPGMQATAFIDAGSAKDVLLIPLEAIFEEDGKSMVEILQADGTVKMVPVKLGLMNDRYAQVKSGVKEGDLVITGSTADLLPSQHIKSEEPILPDKKSDDKKDTDAAKENNN